VEQEEHGGAAAGTVTCRYVASRATIDREARALRRWQLRRGAFWWRWGLTWTAFVVAVLLGVQLLVGWLAPEASGFLAWAVYLGVAMMLAAALVDAATLPQRWLRRFLKIVERRAPAGTPVEQTFSHGGFTVSTPTSTFDVPAAMVTRATLVRGCLVLEGDAKGFWVMNGEGISDEAFQVVIDTLGDRLSQR
jgi:hypothetical protein